ncbi:MAG: FecR family protein [Alistipes onderdonkii]
MAARPGSTHREGTNARNLLGKSRGRRAARPRPEAGPPARSHPARSELPPPEPLAKGRGGSGGRTAGRGRQLLRRTGLPAQQVQTNIVTSAHDKGEYVLPDGTRIWLNAGSVLRYYGDLSGRKRVVELTGEAFFKVRRDEKRPFILKADDMNIEVLGTEFDFINYAEFSTTEVILCSGSVRAFGGRLPRPVILKPGERLAYSKKDGRISLSQVTALNYSQWMNGELSFDNAPLSDIIANLQRWYAVEIDCPEEWARQVRMSFAVIRNESIDEILKAMSLVVDINYARENRHVTIIPRESRNHK